MKKIPFVKMAAAGNDFVIIDRAVGDLKKLAVRICNRKTGIGADGLLVLEKSQKADHKMRIINSDGSEAEMCGNGVRCLATYIKTDKGFKKNLFSIETLAGIIRNEVKGTIAAAHLSDPKTTKKISHSMSTAVLYMSAILTPVFRIQLFSWIMSGELMLIRLAVLSGHTIVLNRAVQTPILLNRLARILSACAPLNAALKERL